MDYEMQRAMEFRDNQRLCKQGLPPVGNGFGYDANIAKVEQQIRLDEVRRNMSLQDKF